MSKVVIGIDPGNAGAIAWKDGNGVRHVVNMPDTPLGVLNQIREIEDEVDENGDLLVAQKDFVCYLEDVGYGIPGQASNATAKFARHNGHLEMAMLAEGIKMVKVTPQKWEKIYSLGKSSECTHAEWKRKLKQRAEELFPQFKVTLKNADALLILNYGEEQERK